MEMAGVIILQCLADDHALSRQVFVRWHVLGVKEADT